MKYSTLLIAATALTLISGCGNSKNFEYRKSHLMFDCQCEPGTYKYSYELAGLLIEEQKETRKYIENNKTKFLECDNMKTEEYEALLNHIDVVIQHNEDARPYFITKLFFGDSQVRDITHYKEAKLDGLIKHIEDACSKQENKTTQTKSNTSIPELPAEANKNYTPKESQSNESTPQTAPPTRKLSAAAEKAIQEGFVEIKNPTVKACTDEKINAIQKKNGEDSLINYQTYNEIAVECGFDI